MKDPDIAYSGLFYTDPAMKTSRYLVLAFLMTQPVILFSGTMSSNPIDFGSITLLTMSGGSVQINSATGALTPSGDVNVSGGARGYARYHLTGNTCKCSLNWSGLPSTLNLSGPGTLQITGLTPTFGADYNTSGSCGGAFQYTTNPVIGYWYNPTYGTYYIGATANITSATKPGTYSGSFTISSSGNTREQALIGTNQCTMWPGPETADSLSTTVNVAVNVVWPLTITETAALDFGKIVSPAANCTAVVNTNGSSGGSCSTLAGTAAPGSFQVSGFAGTTVNYSVSPSTLGGMTLDTFTMSPSGGSAALDGSGQLNITVGATLHVPANKTPGTYTGTYTITVNYQ